MTFAITKYKDEIIEKINENRVTIISGNTGCGKTTQVPKLIYEDLKSKNENAYIICTQPRRIAAQSIARRVA